MAGLTIRQERFCVEYAKSGNATKAYKAAGYRAKTDNAVSVTASKMLRNAKVKERIAELQKEIADTSIADAQEIQKLLTEAMRRAADKGDNLGLCKTADILNKMHGTYITRTEVTGAGGGPLQFDWSDGDG